jgi:hypothetical protein
VNAPAGTAEKQMASRSRSARTRCRAAGARGVRTRTADDSGAMSQDDGLRPRANRPQTRRMNAQSRSPLQRPQGVAPACGASACRRASRFAIWSDPGRARTRRAIRAMPASSRTCRTC